MGLGQQDHSVAQFPGWALVIGQLVERRPLGAELARLAMAEILAGAAAPAQIAGFAIALAMKGETAEELGGMVAAMLEVAERVPIDPSGPAIDIVGTGGDRAGTINVSTMAALVAAGAGAKVCKHGNRAASSACGTADVLEALGVVIDLGPEGVARCVAEAGIGFCFAPRFHPAMRHAAAVRRELGVPTVFNLLGPLANPGRVRRYLLGVADSAMAEPMARVLAAGGAERALVVHGADGLDELTITGPSTVVELDQGELRRWVLEPGALGIELVGREALAGGDAASNAMAVRAVLAGARGPHRDIVALNAAAGLVVAGLAPDLAAGLDQAAAAIDSAAAAAALDRLVEVSRAASQPSASSAAGA